MKKAKVVIGSNFGDEGKGLMTDYFCAKAGQPVLNIRFNGGAQAGHTVDYGRHHHVFSHLGAGSFSPHAETLLSSYFFIDPIRFNREYEQFSSLLTPPRIMADLACRIVLPYDIFINQMVENQRKGERHGSCGFGIFECRRRNCTGEFALTLGDVVSATDLRGTVRQIRDIYGIKRLKECGLRPGQFPDYEELWNMDELIESFLEDLRLCLTRIQVSNQSAVLNDYEELVFEGAQGLLLDEMNESFTPHLTPSRTGLGNVIPLLEQIRRPLELEVCYVTRSYYTRHGAGRFDTEVRSKEYLRHPVCETTNRANPWQGAFRFGYFDLPQHQAAINADLRHLKQLNKGNLASCRTSLAITHLNTTGHALILPERDLSAEQYMNMNPLSFNCFYLSSGRLPGDILHRHMIGQPDLVF